MPASRESASAKGRHLLRSSALALGLALGCSIGMSSAAAQESVATYNIEGQSLAEALTNFGRLSGTQIIFSDELVNGRTAPTLRGDYPAAEALRLLLAGSGLRAERTSTGAIMIVDENWRPQRADAAPTRDDSAASETIVVTGTRIRGGPPTAPIRVVGRDEIEQSGYAGVGELVRSLPENFGGGQNPGHIGTPTANSTFSNASTVNIRGLGDGATLVLLNGRRLPPDSNGQSPDISGIPLQALQRIEVVKDGSSAVYGSDAVAGVMNFILRSDYNGAELGVRYGESTRGGGAQALYSALIGTANRNWHALLSAEYANQDAINTRERDITSTAPDVPLSREEERASVFLNAGVDLTNALSLEIDALWSQRDSANSQQTRSSAVRVYQAFTSPSYLVNTELTAQLPSDWQMHVDASVSRSRMDLHSLRTGVLSHRWHENTDHGVEASFDGPIPSLLDEDIRAAFGLGAREELYGSQDAQGRLNLSRDVAYVFGELLVPVVAPSTTRPGLHELDINLSARYEEYSDFGSSTTPRVGIRYVPFSGLSVRTSWGESFKAPSFVQMGLVNSVQIMPATSMGGTSGIGMLTGGGSLDLRPELSTSWTFGVDYESRDLSSLVLGATYFDIDYTDRVVTPVSPIASALSNPIFANYIIQNPSEAQQAAAIAAAGPAFVFNTTGAAYNPSTVTVMVVNNFTNAASQKAEGVDLSYRQTFELPLGDLSTFANGTWIHMTRQTLLSVPARELTGTIANVPEVRIRGGASWAVGEMTATGIVNYQSGSTDNGIVPNQEIGSWTTADANVSYRFGAETGVTSGVELVLSVQNLFDRDPPYAASPAVLHQGIFFDSVNASAVGRFVSVALRKTF